MSGFQVFLMCALAILLIIHAVLLLRAHGLIQRQSIALRRMRYLAQNVKTSHYPEWEGEISNDPFVAIDQLDNMIYGMERRK